MDFRDQSDGLSGPRGTSPPPPPRPQRVDSEDDFLQNATISQDDTRGRQFELLQMLSLMRGDSAPGTCPKPDGPTPPVAPFGRGPPPPGWIPPPGPPRLGGVPFNPMGRGRGHPVPVGPPGIVPGSFPLGPPAGLGRGVPFPLGAPRRPGPPIRVPPPHMLPPPPRDVWSDSDSSSVASTVSSSRRRRGKHRRRRSSSGAPRWARNKACWNSDWRWLLDDKRDRVTGKEPRQGLDQKQADGKADDVHDLQTSKTMTPESAQTNVDSANTPRETNIEEADVMPTESTSVDDTPANTDDNGKSDGAVPLTQAAVEQLDQELPSISEMLGLVAKHYLDLDLLDPNRDISGYIGYLLDTIQSLEGQVRYRTARSSSGSDSGSDKSVGGALLTGPPMGPFLPMYKILRRITIKRNSGGNGIHLYENSPILDAMTSSNRGAWDHLKIYNLEIYLRARPDLAFVVIKESTRDGISNTRLSRFNSPADQRHHPMRICSPILNEALWTVAEFNPYHTQSHDPAERILHAPYTFLFHHWDKLKCLCDESSEFKPVLRPLLAYIDDELAQDFSEAADMFARGMVSEKHIHKLFKPNDAVIKGSRALVLANLPEKNDNQLQLSMWDYGYDGRRLERSDETVYINALPRTEVPIITLEAYPLKYAQKTKISSMRERGKKFWNMRNRGLYSFSGHDTREERHYSDVRMMVDTATYHQIHHRSRHQHGVWELQKDPLDPWPQSIHRDDDLPEDCEVLLPANIYGFVMETKKWVLLPIRGFRPIEWNKKAFDRLVLDKNVKELILALISVHANKGKPMDDIIRGKGNGLIVLLHGSPGTGKTLTAESVAEIVEKPLYRVTCGDIGTNAQEVEKYLQTVLYLGKIWDCVLLLDEADVFLEERTMADLQRNSLVSVFLRVLEYHEGILMLTSNRVGTFDEAFKSRIQVAIHYEHLTRRARRKIWSNFFEMLEERTEDGSISNDDRSENGNGDDDDDNDDVDHGTDYGVNFGELTQGRRLDELAAEEMNGRQIRNALLTARQLARYKRERLDWEHLAQVMKTSAAFNKYLKTVRGHSDEQWAREEALR